MTETTRQRAIEDVARAFGFLDVESCKVRIEKHPTRGIAYAVTQRERVLILEAENAELKAKLEGQWNARNLCR